MENVKHTPGKWSYTRNPENTRWIIDSEPNRAIATTAGYEPDNEANARLIAAAPELLAAATYALEVLAPHKDDDFAWSAMSQIIRALTQARGEQP